MRNKKLLGAGAAFVALAAVGILGYSAPNTLVVPPSAQASAITPGSNCGCAYGKCGCLQITLPPYAPPTIQTPFFTSAPPTLPPTITRQPSPTKPPTRTPPPTITREPSPTAVTLPPTPTFAPSITPFPTFTPPPPFATLPRITPTQLPTGSVPTETPTASATPDFTCAGWSISPNPMVLGQPAIVSYSNPYAYTFVSMTSSAPATASYITTLPGYTWQYQVVPNSIGVTNLTFGYQNSAGGAPIGPVIPVSTCSVNVIGGTPAP